MATIGLLYRKKFKSRYVGTDDLGHSYFEEKVKDEYSNRCRRFVIYKGVEDPTSLSLLWWAWLHYVTDCIPSGEVLGKKRLVHATGTLYAKRYREYVQDVFYKKRRSYVPFQGASLD